MTNYISFLCLCLLVLATVSDMIQAFVPPNNVMNNHLSSSFSISGSFSSSSSVLFANKKRRRKKTVDSQSQPAAPSSPAPTDELPDFELAEEREEKPKKKKPVASLDEITPEMMGAPGTPARSVSELIKDRDLESKFEFENDEGGDVSIPDFTQVSSSQADSQPRGTLRKTKKIGAVDAKEEESNPFGNIPFIKDEKGNISIVKILEAGAWLGIFLLIGWEVYINSPLFDRSAPMAPVVFELYL